MDKFSLWLMPSRQDEPALRGLIERFAQAFGSAPFPPHITLCSGVADACGLDELASRCPSLTVALTNLAFGEDYHHGCYWELGDPAPVMQLQQLAAAALRATVPPGYPPHLSLAYGVLDQEQRRAAHTLLRVTQLRVVLEGLALWRTSGPEADWQRVR